MHYRDHSPSISIGAFFGLCALIIVPVCYVKYSAETGGNVRSAEAELKQWAAKLDIDIDKAHISCNSADSDNDGYVSCSYKDKVGEVHQVECAGAFNLQHGCRVPKPNLNVTINLQHGCRVPKPNLNVTNISTESTSSRRR